VLAPWARRSPTSAPQSATGPAPRPPCAITIVRYAPGNQIADCRCRAERRVCAHLGCGWGRRLWLLVSVRRSGTGFRGWPRRSLTERYRWVRRCRNPCGSPG